MHQRDFFIRERRRYAAFHAVDSNDEQMAQAYVAETVLSMHHRRKRHDRIFSGKQRFADAAHRYGNGVIRRLFVFDDLASRSSHIVDDFVVVGRVHRIFAAVFDALAIIFDSYRRNFCQGPGNKGGIPVLAHDVSVYIFLADSKIIGQIIAQARRIQDRSRTDDYAFRQSGIFHECVCQYVHRIADDDIKRFRRMLCDLRRDLFDNVDICLSKVEPGLTGFSRKSRGYDHDIGSLRVFIGSGINGYRTAERSALFNIHRFSERLLFVNVNEYDFRSNSLYGHSIGDCRADAACSDNCYLIAHIHPLFFIFNRAATFFPAFSTYGKASAHTD